VALLAGAAAFVGWKQPWRKPPASPWQTTEVATRDIAAKVTASGTVSALVTVLVGSQVSGRLAAIHVDFNSPVKKGQELARIDPRQFEAAVAQAQANLQQAQGALAKAKAQSANADLQLERTKDLVGKRLVAQADQDTAQAAALSAHADIEAASGNVAQARAQLEQSRLSLSYTHIVSPVDGIVISRSVDVGQTVAASLQAPTLFTIAEDLAKMQVDTNVAEADVGKLKSGAQATFQVDAYPGETFKGVIRQVRNAPQTVQNVVTYDAVIDVDNSAGKLKPGMTANVTFVWSERPGALAVPNAALRFRPKPEQLSAAASASAAVTAASSRRGEGGGARGEGAAGRGDGGGGASRVGRSVWVLRDGQPVRVPIKPGLSDAAWTEVVEGSLAPGDAVNTDSTDPSAAPASAPAGGGAPGMGMRRVL
jgi:HlyD family secretion protein